MKHTHYWFYIIGFFVGMITQALMDVQWWYGLISIILGSIIAFALEEMEMNRRGFK